MSRLMAIITAVVLIVSMTGAAFFFEDRYAKASDLTKNYIADRVSDLKAAIRWYQDQMAYVMTRCGTRDPNKMPEHAYRSYMEYKAKKDAAELELSAAMTK